MARTQIAFFIFFFSVIFVKSQGITINEIARDPFNFLVLIDGKLAHVYGEAYFYKDSIRYTFLFSSYYGRIELTLSSLNQQRYIHILEDGHFEKIKIDNSKTKLLSKQELSIFDSIPDTTKVHMTIIWKKPLDAWSNKTYFYYFSDKLTYFLSYNIITITNLKEKEKVYYVHRLFKSHIVLGLGWKKEYGNKRKFEKRVFEGIHPSGYLQVEKHAKPIY